MQRIKKRNGKRILSCILTFAVVAGLLPGSLLVAHADTFTEGQAVRYQSTPAQPVTIEQSGYYYVEAFGGNGGAGGAQGSGGSTDYRASGGVGAEARTLYWFDAGAMIYIQAGTVGSNGFRDTNNTNNSFPYPGVVGGTGTYFGSGGASGAGGTNGGVLAAGVRGGSGGGGGAASGILVGGTELSNIYLAAGGGGGAGGTSRNGTGGNGGAAGTAGFNAEKNGSGLGGTTQNLNLTNGSIGGAGAGGYTQNGGGGGGGGGGGFDGTSGGGGESGTGGVSCGIASSTSNGGGGGAGGSSYTKNVATTPANLILPENSTRTNANGEVIITYLGAGYTVTYDANGGTGEVPVDSTTYPSGASVTVLGQGTLEKAGFSFSGWQQDINFYSEGDTFDIADDITLYAIWIPTYNVTYDANGGTGDVPVDNINYESGTTVTVLGQGTLEKDGFSFNGWMQDDIYYYEDDTFEITNDMTLYAVWIPVYNVTYHANGGTGDVPVDDMNYESGATVNVLGQGDLTMEGYTLYGWMNNFNFYREGDTFEITKDMTLKAVWTKYIPVPQVITYNVTYDANGGTGDVPVDDINYTAGTTVTVLGQGTLERDGYTFGGWQHNFNFYQPGDTFTITNGITLNALWILEVPITPDIYYNVTYDANGGTGDVPVDDINYESGTEVIILGKGDLERDGYTFGGWQYGFNFYQPGDTFYITNNITLNALWVLEVPVTPDIYYNVTYDANGGTGNVPVDNINYTAGTSMTVLGQGDLEKEGYTFHGWMYDIYFYYEGDMLDITNDMTLYAIWIEDEPVTYNVTYNANGGTGTVPVDNINYTDGTNATVASRGNLAMRGYTFLNWNTESDRTGVTYIAGSMITMDSDVTLYAQWRRNSDDDDDDTSTSGSDSTDPVDPDDDDETSDGNEIGSDSGSDSSNPYDNIVIIGEGDVPLGGLEDIVHIRYLSGYDDGSVKPDKAITRAEAASIFYRLLKETYTDGSAPKTFSDVSSDAWYSIAISKLAENGIIGGYPDGTFRPDQPITRAEFATITSKFDKLILTSGIAFSDVPEDHWAVQYINSAYVNGWVDGYSDYSFKPENPITRAEAVKIINTILNRKILLEDIPESAPEYIDLDKSHWAHCDIIEASTEHTYTRKDNDYEIWE